jgi:transcriptional regulator with XRE-family HTH domain
MTPADLKAWRKNHNYTQQELADALTVTKLTISRWERETEGKNKRQIPSFLHLALEALECRGDRKSVV